MTGDLQDLMHGAEDAKRRAFASEDFAGGYGRSVIGRVKRRRAASATAMGGGTVVAVGALAVGASTVPWGTFVLGASPAGPSNASTPAPSGAERPSVLAGSSPFQCGFVFAAPEGSTGVITVGEPRWLTPGQADAAVRSFYGDHEEIELALSGSDVPILQFSSISTWPGGNYGGDVGPTDPAEHRGGFSYGADGATISGGYIDGAQFVLAADDVVIATYSPEDVAGNGRTQYVLHAGDGHGTLYGLNLASGFTACPGVEPDALEGAQAVAVAGTMLVDGEKAVEGPYYAWRYVERTE